MISEQLIKIAKEASKDEEKVQSKLKNIYGILKKQINKNTFFKHKLKNKIVNGIVNLIQKLQSNNLLSESEAGQLINKLNGNKTASVKTDGKKSAIFFMIVVLIKLIMPLTTYCNVVSQNQEQKIVNSLKQKTFVNSYSAKQIKDGQFNKTLQVYSDDQKVGTDIVKIAIQFSNDDLITQHFFTLRVKSGSNNIIKPNNLSNAQFEKVKTLIAIFDTKDRFGFRNECNQKVQAFIKYNEKQLGTQTDFIVTTQKDDVDNKDIHIDTYSTIVNKNQFY